MDNNIVVNGIEDLIKYADDNRISRKDICIVGSAVMSSLGIRANNDLEVALRPDVYRRFVKEKKIYIWPWGHAALTDNIDLFHNIYGIAGFSDETLFKISSCELNGFRIAGIELEWRYKKELIKFMHRKKDFEDIKKIEQYFAEHTIAVNDKLSFRNNMTAMYYTLWRRLEKFCLYIR